MRKWGRSRRVEALREIDSPSGIVVVALIVGRVPGNANRPRRRAGRDPWHEVDSCSQVGGVVDFDRGPPRRSVISGTDEEDIVPVGVTEIDGTGLAPVFATLMATKILSGSTVVGIGW